jgi:glycerol kinase
MPDKYILTIDQSTSGTKAIIFDGECRFMFRETIEHRQYYPKTGWVEHDPEEIYRNTLEAARLVLKNINPSEITFLSLTNQRETVVVWDKQTGKPLYNAVVWQCQRGAAFCDELKEKGLGPLIQDRTGLIIDPYFSASGVHWILHNVNGAKEKAKTGDLLIGTIDSWLIWKLTGGQSYVTDYTNACRTMLFNIHTMTWDKEILDIMGIPVSCLPEVRFSDDIFGKTNMEGIFPHSIPIAGVMGDSHAALFGQCCYHKGLSKVTYGTGSSVMMNIGSKPAEPPKGLVTSIGFAIKDQTDYVFEGNIHSTGATIKWMVESLQLIQSASESEELASSILSTDGVYFVPAFAGLGAPYWDTLAKATIWGIHGGTRKAHVVRAGLESIAYQVKDLLDLMAGKAGMGQAGIRVDGGPTRNKFLMQFQSDILSIPIGISRIEEASALGAAMTGGIGSGLWKDIKQLETVFTNHERIIPSMPTEQRDQLYDGWKKAVNLVRGLKF